MSDFKYKIDPDYDYVVDEKGNTFVALRKIIWGDSDKAKLDLRKYYSREEGETMSKGVSFLTDDGPNELTKVLVETGYGKPKEIADAILNNRPDIGAYIWAGVENNPEYAEAFQVALEQIDDADNEQLYSPDELVG